MIDFSQWSLPVPEIALAAGAALCLVFAVLFVIAGARRQAARNAGDATQERAQESLKLHCGDLKALANLAIQRHMEDALFLQHLRDQPCYNALLTQLDINLQQQLTKAPAEHSGKSTLAIACLKDIDRLERKLFGSTAGGLRYKRRP